MTDIYLAAHRRTHLFGQVINAASVLRHGTGQEPHATHVYVIVRMGTWCWRLDGDIPTSTLRSARTIPTDPELRPRVWRFASPDPHAVITRFADLVDHAAPYDGGEVIAAALQALRLPAPPDALKRAMICTRLAQVVLGVPQPETLFPEALVRQCQRDPRFTRVDTVEFLKGVWP